MVSIAIQIKGGKELQAKLQKAGTNLLDFPEAMDSIGRMIKSYAENEVFASQGQAIGERWAQAKAATQKWKAKHFPGTATMTLIRSGKMMRAFEYAAGPRQVRVTNAAEYFKYHQLGTKYIPQRIMLMVNQRQKQEIKDIINTAVQDKLARIGLT